MIRLAYASDLPTPEEALRKLGEAGDGPRRPPSPTPPPVGGGPRAALRLAASGAAPVESGVTPSILKPAALFRPPRPSGSRVSKTSSRWPAPSETFSLFRRLNGRCGWRGLNRAASPLRRSQAPRPAWLRRSRDACRNGPANGGWWRWSQAQTLPLCARRLRRARPNAQAAPRRIRWSARSSSQFKGARIVDVRVPEPQQSAPAPDAEIDVGYADTGIVGEDDI